MEYDRELALRLSSYYFFKIIILNNLLIYFKRLLRICPERLEKSLKTFKLDFKLPYSGYMLWKRRETTYSIKLGNEPLSNVAKLNLKSLIAFTGAIIGVATASHYLMNYYEKLEDPDRDFISTYYEKRVFNTDQNLADTIWLAIKIFLS